MSDAKKKFDAVAMMRAARDKISAEIAGMTLEEEIRWLGSQELGDPFLERLRDRATRRSPPIPSHDGPGDLRAGQRRP